MDFQSKKSKITVISICTVIMIIAAYFQLRENNPEEKPYSGTDKYVRTGKADSDSNIEKTRDKMQKEYERDVKSYSFTDFLNSQIDKEPELSKYKGEEIIGGERGETEIVRQEEIQEVIVVEQKEANEGMGTGTKTGKAKTNSASTNAAPKTVATNNSEKQELTGNQQETAMAAVQPQQRRTGFAGSGSTSNSENSSQESTVSDSHSIKVAVLQTKKIKQGDIVMLRNTEDFIFKNRKIPANTLLAGNTSFSGSRLTITVKAIPVGDESISCNLIAYDLDGNAGLKLNRDISYELKGDVANTAIGEAGKVVKVPYVSDLARQMGTKTVNDPTVTVEQGQKMILRNSN